MFWRHLSRFLLAFSFLSSADIFPQAEEFVDLQIITVASQQQLREILALLEKGQEFADLAREYSTDPTAGNGGFLGRMQLSDLNEGLRGGVGKAAQAPSSISPIRSSDSPSYDVWTPEQPTGPIPCMRFNLEQQSWVKSAMLMPSSSSRKPFRWIRDGPRPTCRLGHAYRMTGSYNLIGEAKGSFDRPLHWIRSMCRRDFCSPERTWI